MPFHMPRQCMLRLATQLETRFLFISPIALLCHFVDASTYTVSDCAQVESLDEMSAPTRVGERCFERVVLCDQHCFWNWPPDGSWLEAVQPHSVAQQARMLLHTSGTSSRAISALGHGAINDCCILTRSHAANAWRPCNVWMPLSF
jgi:hypothetical protein